MTINLACVAMAMLQYGACACMLALTHARGRGLRARRQSNANCVPLKPPSLCHPGLSLQLSLLGKWKTNQRNKEKKKCLALSGSDMSQTFGKETREGNLTNSQQKKKKNARKDRYFSCSWPKKSDVLDILEDFSFFVKHAVPPSPAWEQIKRNKLALNKVWRQRKSERRNNTGQSALYGPHKSNHIKLSQSLQ